MSARTCCAVAIAVSIGAVGLVGCGSGTGADSAPRLQKAYDACQALGDVDLTGIEVADGGESLLVNGVKKPDGMACILVELDTPKAIVANMDSTTAMMGRQHEVDDGLEYEWSYHPDNGFDLTITEE